MAAFALATSAAYSYEVDNFTDRDSLSRDAMPVVDRKVNDLLKRAVAAANQESPRYCSRAILRQELVRWIRPDPAGILELWATTTDSIQRTSVPRRESIYAGASFLDAPMLVLAGIGRSFKMNGHVIGTDKIGHFFMQGLDYFERVENGKPLEWVLSNAHGEDGIWGLRTSGVKSYADMATNYQGYRFWSQLYSGQDAYLKCTFDGRWEQVRAFTFGDYVSDAWDEAINCSAYKPGLESRVKRNLNHRGVQCPLEPAKCHDISRLAESKYFLSPSCRSVVEVQNQP